MADRRVGALPERLLAPASMLLLAAPAALAAEPAAALLPTNQILAPGAVDLTPSPPSSPPPWGPVQPQLVDTFATAADLGDWQPYLESVYGTTRD